MDPAHWRQIEFLYHAALERREEDRSAFLAQLQPEICREVAELLAQSGRSGILDRSAAALLTTATATAPALASPQFGAYQVISLLGRGGMGEVYRAHDSKLGRDVAIKMLPASYSSQPAWLARFRREARALAALNHPNIAAIYGMEASEGLPYLVMELVEGKTLAERLSRGAVPLPDVIDIARQLVDALEAAHTKGITHRDVKPANLKLTPEGRLKVLDFGLAKMDPLGAGPHFMTQTETGVAMGTPAYMSPEQIRGHRVDSRSDIWAFGCVMFELLSGVPPFEGTSAPDLFASILKAEPRWNLLPGELSGGIRDLLRSCLAKDVWARPQDMGAVRAALKKALQPETTVAPAAPSITSLAVLPFSSAGGALDLEYLGDGLAQSIIFSLSGGDQLRVMSRGAVVRYQNSTQEPHEIGRGLGVSAVLTGRIQQRGSSLVVTAELVDVSTGFQLWGSQYKRGAEDVFALEEQLATEISANLRLKLSPRKQEERNRRRAENVEAYHLYLRGMHQWGKRTGDRLKRAIQYFRQAIEVDPAYAAAHAGLAGCYVPLAIWGHVAPSDAWPKAKAAARHALAIDPGLADARTILAYARAYYDGDLPGAEQELRAIVDVHPDYARAWQALAEVLMIAGSFADSEREAKRALSLDPLALHLNAFLAMTYYFSGRHADAVDQARRALDLDEDFYVGQVLLGLAAQQTGDIPAAIEAFHRATELSSRSTLALAGLGCALAVSGQHGPAREILSELEGGRDARYVSQVALAAIYGSLDETDHAVACLKRAAIERCPWRHYALWDARFDRLRTQKEVRELLKPLC